MSGEGRDTGGESSSVASQSCGSGKSFSSWKPQFPHF